MEGITLLIAVVALIISILAYQAHRRDGRRTTPDGLP